MNKKGFTLIELLAVIVVIGIVGIIVVPSALNIADKSKEASYQILVKNIVIAAENYYQECEYGGLSDTSKYKNYCWKNGTETTEIETTIGKLAELGILNAETVSSDATNKVKDPRNNQDISSCPIVIAKVKDDYGKVTYKISASNDSSCPTQADYDKVKGE